MPSAGSLNRDELSYSLTIWRSTIRHAVSFQLSDRLTFALRYNLSYFPDENGKPFAAEDNFDRSLGLHYHLLDEGSWTPALAVGVNDILGTGRFESEYVVASKHLTPALSASLGIGWGRMASRGGFDNPLAEIFPSLADRDPLGTGNVGGKLNDIRWFQGDAALFGGISWQATDRLRLTAEYSSDAYVRESGRAFTPESPYNFAAHYTLSDRVGLGIGWLYGSELGVNFTYRIDPGQPRAPSGYEPMPVMVTPAAQALAQPALTQAASQRVLEGQGVALHGLTIRGTTAQIEIENQDWGQSAQAIGRTARALTATLPPSVTQLEIVLVERGLPVSRTTIPRAELAVQEFALDNAWEMQSRSRRDDALASADPGFAPLPGLYPRFDWSVAPYLAPSFFDPHQPLRADFGLDLGASYELAPGVIVSGVLRQRVIGNRDESRRASTSVLPHVRSDAWLYDKTDTSLARLTADWYFRPAEALYGRVTAGLLEPMYAGAAAELLWAPAGSALAFGAEVATVRQRDFDQGFGLVDYEIATGHLSAYWNLDNGYQAQLDLGRYLAGDWGGTVTVERVFDNGWRLGMFATVTDVSADDFGEGSFDKGVILEIPVSWGSGLPNRQSAGVVLRPVQRDGGARLELDGRLYDLTRPASVAGVEAGWGRFWR